jgi:hypothetical protein
MILIEFQVDELALAENLKDDISSETRVSFVVTMFLMPVRFQVEGVDLFEYNGDPWAEMPIMNMASEGLMAVKDLRITGKEEYDLMQEPGTFYFTMVNNLISRKIIHRFSDQCQMPEKFLAAF